jgi:hypothetical protein
MRKTVVVLLSAAFVATLPSIASAKRMHHHHHHRHVVTAPVTDNAGPRLVANALHQLVVPLEVTFARPRHRRHYR